MTTRQSDAHGSHRWDLRGVRRSRWFQPLLAIFLGAVLLAVLSIGGHPQEGTAAFVIMVAFAIFLLAAQPRLRGASVASPRPAAGDFPGPENTRWVTGGTCRVLPR